MNSLLGNKKLLLLLVILVGIGGFFGWKTFSKKDGEEPVYQTAQVERGTIVSSVSASGGVISANVFEVTTKASGIVKGVFVKDGDEVVKGQKLMEITLDQDGEQELGQKYAAYLSARNSLESAKTRQLTLESTALSKKQAFEDVKESNSYQTESEQTDFHTAENDWLAAKETYENQQSVIVSIGLMQSQQGQLSQRPTIP